MAPPPGTEEEVRRARLRAIVGIAILIALTAFTFWRMGAGGPTLVTLDGATMGTTWTVKVAGVDAAARSPEQLGAVVQAALDGVDAQMSTYRSDSELMRLNQHRAQRPFPISAAMGEVLSRAQRVSEWSGGAFDITVSPLVRAWGFGAGAREDPPTEEQLAALREHVGYQKLRLLPGPRAVAKTGIVHCDLSAIAKGWGVDRVAEALEAMGLRHYMIEVGGEVRARGRNARGEAWRIAVETPTPGARGAQTVVALDGLGMATSGTYRNFYQRGGRRISHLIDPRTGRPTEHPLVSVTVVHAETAMADALATAIHVLGPQRGWALATEKELAVLLIAEQGGSLTERATPQFEALRVVTDALP